MGEKITVKYLYLKMDWHSLFSNSRTERQEKTMILPHQVS